MNENSRYYENSEEERAAKEDQLWEDMIDSLTQFTQTSTALIKGMKNEISIKKGVLADIGMDPSGILEQIKEELVDMEDPKYSPNVCSCTASQTVDTDDNDMAMLDAPPGIDCYKEPKLKKKKKFKYSSGIESKFFAQKKRVPRCRCNNESSKFSVDECICNAISDKLSTFQRSEDEIGPTKVCSELSREEIDNILCSGAIPDEIVPLKKETTEEDSSLAWIRKPLSFFPDKLPQDDTHPLIITTDMDDHLELPKNSLGCELWNAMRKYESNKAQIYEYSHEFETYSTYAKKCVQLATKLRKELSKKDIIGICSGNHKNAYVPYIAGLFNGNIVVAFDRLSEKEQFANCLKNVTPSIMFVGDHELTFLEECMDKAKVHFKVVVFGDSVISGLTNIKFYLDGSDIILDSFEVENTEDLNSTCLICFTGGNPESKAVCLSHNTILKQCLQLILSQHILPITMSFLEIYQITSLLVLFSSIMNGATRVTIRDFDEYFVWLLVQKYEVNTVYLHPHHLITLSELNEPDEDTSSLYYIFTTGERLKTNAVKRLKKDLLYTIICQSYESAHMGGYLTMFDFMKREDGFFSYFLEESCGRPIDGISYKVVDLKTSKILPRLTPGELFIKIKSFRNGYFVNNREERHFTDDWISTGDYMFYDNNQCFHFVSRIRDLITFRGTIIVPFKLENILSSHPCISEAVVYPISHVQDGQHAAAVVVVKESQEVNIQHLEEWINSKVPEDEKLRGGLKVVNKISHESNGRLKRNAFSSVVGV